jgi:hypothetical protein
MKGHSSRPEEVKKGHRRATVIDGFSVKVTASGRFA